MSRLRFRFAPMLAGSQESHTGSQNPTFRYQIISTFVFFTFSSLLTTILTAPGSSSELHKITTFPTKTRSSFESSKSILIYKRWVSRSVHKRVALLIIRGGGIPAHRNKWGLAGQSRAIICRGKCVKLLCECAFRAA